MPIQRPAHKAPPARPAKPAAKPAKPAKPVLKPRFGGRKDPEGDIRIKDPGPSIPPG